MGKKSPQIVEFQKSHNITESEMWEVRPGSWAVKHAAIERIVAEKGIKFERPTIIEVNTAEKIMVICVFGTLGGRAEWSFGEASPANCKIAYPASIAEKRAKDRVAIKLLNATGETIYSEDESDDFKRPNPHNTKPEDVFDQPEFDERGQPIDNIPMADGVKALPKKDSRQTYKNLQTELQGYTNAAELQAWAETIPDRVASLPPDWAAIFRGQYKEHLAHLRSANGKAA